MFPDKFVFYNSRDKNGIKILGIKPEFSKGDTNADKFLKYNDSLDKLKELYLKIVGQRTQYPVNLEIDQFFYYLDKTIDNIEVFIMHEYVKNEYPSWQGFDDPRFIKDEIEYKKEIIEDAKNLLDKTLLSQLLDNGNYEEFYINVEKIAKHKNNNLLYRATPKSGDLQILYDEKLDRPSFCKAFYDLLYGDGDSPERLDRFSRYTIENKLKNKWTFPTYYLFLLNTDKDMFVKPDIFRWFLKMFKEKYKSKPDGKLYKKILEICESLKKNLQKFNPKDMLDIQSFIFVSYSGKPVDRKYWLIAPGEGASQWEEWQEKGIISIGYGIHDDLNTFKNKTEIKQVLQKIYNKKNVPNSLIAVYEFHKKMKPGDILFVKQGVKEILGKGIIKSDYYFDDTKEDYNHLRDAEWEKMGKWDISGDYKTQLPIKTLTDITNNKKLIESIEKAINPPHKPPPPHPEGSSFWWLNANPKIWDITQCKVGEKQTYTTRNKKGNKRRIFKHFEKLKTGDIVLGYISTPNKEISTICRITKGIHDTDEGQVFEFEITEQLENTVSFNELKEIGGLQECEPIKNNQGSLFKLEKEEYEIIREMIDERNPGDIVKIEPYNMSIALNELFISESQINEILSLLKYKKNIILQGPPGVGKTYIARRLAYLMMGKKDKARVQMIQFHQSYSYEDFIQGIRPNDKGNFVLSNGVFFDFCNKSRRNKDKDYFFIIDEINRGNLSKIFGELMMLIEHDKRGEDFALPLTYSKDEFFSIPENLYIIGTMNTADRSLAMVDYALRRRFAFIDLDPMFDSPGFENYLKGKNAEDELVNKIILRMKNLNDIITKDNGNLGKGFCIGHSYFCPDNNHTQFDKAWFEQVINHEIKPLLREYWFDNLEKVEREIKKLLE